MKNTDYIPVWPESKQVWERTQRRREREVMEKAQHCKVCHAPIDSAPCNRKVCSHSDNIPFQD